MILYIVLNNVDGAHQETVSELEEVVLMAVWWLGLGILSSVGLGTYPMILEVTMYRNWGPHWIIVSVSTHHEGVPRCCRVQKYGLPFA